MKQSICHRVVLERRQKSISFRSCSKAASPACQSPNKKCQSHQHWFLGRVLILMEPYFFPPPPAEKVSFELCPKGVQKGMAGGCRGEAGQPCPALAGGRQRFEGPASPRSPGTAGVVPGGEVPPLASLPGCTNPRQELHFSLFQQVFLRCRDLAAWRLGQGDKSHP